MPQHNANVVERSGKEQSQKRKPEIAGQSEDDSSYPKSRDGGEQRPPRLLKPNSVGGDHGHSCGTDRRRGSQPAKPPRSRVQNLDCVDRKQRSRTAKQYREHVKRDRRKNQ